MNIAAYCRVSTDKEDQLNSLEVQKEFFQEYAQKSNYHLARLYADEGISGTKIKKRKEFQRMMADAERGLFDMVVVKDISRFARNTVDLLASVRKLKALGIEVQFLTANMTSMGGSEFVLTVMGALAQEESANMSMAMTRPRVNTSPWISIRRRPPSSARSSAGTTTKVMEAPRLPTCSTTRATAPSATASGHKMPFAEF